MKRYVCTVATGLLLALMSTGTATATILPLPGPSATQETSFGDQTVGEQKNEADVTQAQGNGNLNIAPAVGILGDAETTNAQGNHNTATADVDQSNSVEQTQSSQQKQSSDQGDTGCCDGQSQTAEQKVYGGDQSVDKQRNETDVEQYQGNGNVNVSPAIAVFGDAETTNYQGNGNDADATVTQSNEATQSQTSSQEQHATQDGGSCCKDGQSQTVEQKADFGDQHVGEQRNDADVNQYQGNGNVNVSPAVAVFGNAETKNAQGNHNTATADVDQSNSAEQSQTSHQKQTVHQSGGDCCEGRSQAPEQKTEVGEQHVGEQRNEATVTQKQGNGNLNVSPAVDLGGGKKDSCRSTCKGSWKPSGGNASTTNYQGNWNEATADVDQSNSVEQTQTSYQRQSVVEMCKGLIYR